MKLTRMHIFFAAVACLCFVLTTFSEAVSSKLSIHKSWLVQFRGGASKKPGSSVAKSKKRKNMRRDSKTEDYDDDDDGDDDGEEEEEDRRSKRGKLKSRSSQAASKRSAAGKTAKGKLQLMPWGFGGGNNNKKKGGVSSWLSIDSIRKTGAAIVKEASRKVKVMKSSAFEGLLLKATWPNNEAVPSDLLLDVVKYSIPSYKYARADSDDDPYYMTMHKLWTKMCEKDWRTVTKSLYILHCISRDSSVEDCGRFSEAIKDMAKIRNPKKPDHKYFDVRRLVSELDDHSVPYEPFVTAYGSYVIYRAKHFSNKFEELKNVKESFSEKKVVALLKKAQVLIKTALQCTVSKKERNIIIGQAVKLLAADLRELWKLYGDLLVPLAGTGNPYAEPKAVTNDLIDLLSFYNSSDQAVKAFLTDSAKAFQKLRVKISTEVEPTAVSLESLSSRIAELVKISGGFSAAGSDDSDDDDEEKEESNDDDAGDSAKSSAANSDEDEDGDEEAGEDTEEEYEEDVDNDDEGDEDDHDNENSEDDDDDDDDDAEIEEVEDDVEPEEDEDDDIIDDEEEEGEDDSAENENDDSEEVVDDDDDEEED